MSMEATGYTAVPANILSAPTDTEGYQPTTSSPYPLQPLGQSTSQSAPPAYDSGTAHHQQQQTNTVVVAATQSNTTIISDEAVRPPNYLVLSLLNLLCCCFPMGIIGLVYSLRVDSEFVAGHYAEAKSASDTAKSVNYAGIGICSCLYITLLVVVVIYVIAVFAVASG